MFLLQAHYASPVDYDDAALEQARAACETLRNRLRSGSGEDVAVREAVCEALDDDFNTPRALALLFDAPPEARDTVAEVLGVLGLGSWRSPSRPRPSWWSWPRRAMRPAPSATSPSRPAAGGDRGSRLGGARHRRGPRPRPP